MFVNKSPSQAQKSSKALKKPFLIQRYFLIKKALSSPKYYVKKIPGPA
jgi:hypothetical protein